MNNFWTVDDRSLEKTTGVKEKFQQSGVYEVAIREAYITNSTKSNAQALTVAFENDLNYGRVNLWFRKGDGTENEYATTTINRLTYLCKLKSGNLKNEKRKIKNFSGEEVERIYFPEFEGKEVGIILEVKADDENVNMEAKDFYDIKTQKTSDEILGKKEAKTVEAFRKKYNTKKASLEFEEIMDEESEDEFPF